MYFFTSDIHFNDPQALRMENRPFKSCEAFNSFIFEEWNKQATVGDTIFAIGDWLDCDNGGSELWKTSIDYPKRLNADVVLIMGNNEWRVVNYFFDGNFEKFRQECLKNGFKEVYLDLDISFAGYDFHLTHKPKDYKENVLNLFGHTHRSSGIYYPFGFNVSCDLNHFRLLDENDILFYIETKNDYWDHEENLVMRFEDKYFCKGEDMNKRALFEDLKHFYHEDMGDYIQVRVPVAINLFNACLILRVYPNSDHYTITDEGDSFDRLSCEPRHYLSLFLENGGKSYGIGLNGEILFKDFPNNYNINVAISSFVKFFVLFDNFITENDLT